LLTRNHSICFLGAWLDGCALWRMYYPHQNLAGSGFYCFANRPNFDVIAGSDIVVVQRCCTKTQFDFIGTCRALGAKIVYDLDDDVWDLPESNPAHGPLTAMRNGFISCIQITDLVTTSTKTLKKIVRSRVKRMTNRATGKEIPIVVAENWLDQRLYASPRKKAKFIVGWSGSSSHVEDLMLVSDALQSVATENPDAEIEFRGCEPAAELKKMHNFFHRPWCAVAEFSARMPVWGWSIALAPLTDHPFNASKSGIKMYEAAYNRIPCLASWVKPYDDFVSHDPELRWLLCAGPSAWKPKLRELLNDADRRNDLGERMYNVLTEHYTFNRPHPGWAEAFERVRNL
jgi:hypothetical protein